MAKETSYYDSGKYRNVNINEAFKALTCNMFNAFRLNHDYNAKGKMSENYEEFCQNDDLTKNTANLARIELYDAYKRCILKPPKQEDAG